MNKRFRFVAVASAAVVVAGALSGCSGQSGGATTPDPAQSGPGTSAAAAGTPVSGGSLTVAIPDSIDGWNPGTAVQVSTYQLIREVEAPLLEVSADGKSVVPGLAASWSYNAAKTALTLTLQPKAAFSNGKPVTPADVVFSVKQWQDGPSYGALYKNFIASAKASGPDKVTLTLTAPSSAVLPILTWSNSAIVPAGFDGMSAKQFYAKPIGAGPFQIESQSGNESITLTRNPHFWNAGHPYLDTLTYHVVADTSQRLLQVQSGAAGLADRVPLDSLDAAGGNDSTVLTPSSTMSVITFAESKAPMNDVHFRKAVSLAIDRAALVKSVYDGHATVATGLLPAAIPGDAGCPSCAWATADVSAAKAELAQAKGAGGTVELLVDSSRGIDLLAAQAIQQMLAAIGLKVQITQLDSATLLTRLSGGDFQMAIGNYSAMAPTALDPLSFLAATGYLFSGGDAKLALGAMMAVSSAATLADQEKAVAGFEKANYDAATVVPLLSPDVASVLGAKTHGLQLLPSGLYDASQLWVN
jgi:peptide/nickel transport system substrate-binding protein